MSPFFIASFSFPIHHFPAYIGLYLFELLKAEQLS